MASLKQLEASDVYYLLRESVEFNLLIGLRTDLLFVSLKGFGRSAFFFSYSNTVQSFQEGLRLPSSLALIATSETLFDYDFREDRPVKFIVDDIGGLLFGQGRSSLIDSDFCILSDQ